MGKKREKTALWRATGGVSGGRLVSSLAKTSIGIALFLVSPGNSLCAQEGDEGTSPAKVVELETFQVSETPRRSLTDLQVASPVTHLSRSAITGLTQPSLGGLLEWQPGIGTSSFGSGASRPVIRGFSGNRVRILEDGLSTGDVSAISPDHAVTIEPIFLREAEIVRGPATLFYGNAAIGGAVDVTTARFPLALDEGDPLEGRLNLSWKSVSDEFSAAAVNTAGFGKILVQANAMLRRSGDYAIPGKARREGVLLGHSHGNDSTQEPNPEGSLPNSFVDNEQGSLSIAWIDEGTRLAVAASTFRSRYGVPFHSHASDLGDVQTEVKGARIDLQNDRLDLLLEGESPFKGISEIRVRYGYFDYDHAEIEGDAAQTEFTNRGQDLRLELHHEPLPGGFTGAMGLEWSKHEFNARVRDPSFAGLKPPTLSRNRGVFLLESLRTGPLRIQAGARYEQQENDPLPTFFDLEGDAEERYDAASFALGASLDLPLGFYLSVGRIEAERAPTSGELFANGLHLAVGVFEWGSFFGANPGALRKEEVRHHEITLGRSARWAAFSLTAFHSDFDNYIFLLRGEFETNSGFPIFEHVERPAELYGYEATLRIPLEDWIGQPLSLYVQSDYVRGSFQRPIDPGTGAGSVTRPLPRIPPLRWLSRLEWTGPDITLGLEGRRTTSQNRVELNSETATPGHFYLSADLAWRFQWLGQPAVLRAEVTNLLDAEIRNHLSFLKDVAPEPGRSFGLSIEWSY